MLRRCKEGAWKKASDDEALKCWNLECMIDAELLGLMEPNEMKMAQLFGEKSGDNNEQEL